MTLWMLLALNEVVAFARSDSPQELRWLSACLFLGLGILTKTVPLVLAFLLCHGLSRVSVRGKLLGAALFVGPIATALEVARVLGPVGLVHKILGYRSFGGWFGITGLLGAAGAAEWAGWHAKSFRYALLAALGLLALVVARRRLEGRQLALLAALAIFAVSLLVPGTPPSTRPGICCRYCSCSSTTVSLGAPC